MKLIAYVLPEQRLAIRVAPVAREWMDETNERFAYRCLPLNIANSHGWELLCPHAFAVRWDGGTSKHSLSVSHEQEVSVAASHFGHGILTITLPCVFVTDSAVDLYVQGPVNRPKDGISALTAVVETDWLPFTFTMNWQLTRPNQAVHFAAGEPFCHIFPLERGSLERVEPEIRALHSNPQLQKKNANWARSREDFLKALEVCQVDVISDRWQKDYFLGKDPHSYELRSIGHRTKLHLRPFRKVPAVEDGPQGRE